LAFTVAGDVPTEVPQGARSQSIPGTGEMPQSFETSNKIAARPEWSKIRPRTSRPQFIDEFNAGSLDALYFQGISTNLKPGDLLLLPAGKGYPRAVDSVKADMASSTTKVILQTSLTLEGVLSSLKQSVGGYLDLRSRCLDDSDCTVKAAVDILKGIIDAIDICKGNLSQDCAQKIRSILDLDGKGAIRNISDLIDKIEKGTADEGCNHAGEKGTRKEAWLKSIYDALRKHATELEELPGIESSGTIGALQFSSKASPLTSGLSLVMAPLLKPPSLQPPSSTQLDRPISRIFGPGSDMGPKMLAAMRPGLWDDLYIALANARVTQPPDLSSVPVLGIKASPYGHNAPKMVVTDNKGVVVDQREWPLNGSIRVTASLIPGRGTPFGIAVLGVKRGGKTYGATGDIPFDSQLGDGIKASIKAPDTSSSDYTITFKIPGLNDKKIVVTVISSQVISIAIASTESPVKVDVDGEVFDSVYFDNTLSREKGSHRAEVSRNVDRLFISDESLLPPEETDVLYLDGRYDSITPGSWIAIRRPKAGDPSTTADPMIFRAKRVRTVTRNDYGFSGDSTRIELAGANNGNWLEPKNDVDISVLRGTEVFAQSGSLDLADETIDPVDEPVCGDTIELDGVYDGLESGRWLIVSGERLDIAGTSGVTGSELVMIAGVSQDVEKVADPKNPGGVMDLPGDTNHTFVKLASSLSYIYRRDSLTIYGNVSDATQGESKSEVLGSGDAGKSLQSFTLHQSPLTYIPDSNPTGIKSTLQVRVNDLLWQEVETLAGMGPRDRCYVTLTGDDAKTSIIFGNGAGEPGRPRAQRTSGRPTGREWAAQAMSRWAR
ncbi:MAG TPA: hypothetical protein VN455_07825, partial [Methanotrichaceae archaeon]|nr:hypothetical protein [Methanotrichaceae archaeon]